MQDDLLMPTLYIIAGPNGVGKTTFADRYLPDEAKQLEFVNADLIARGLSPYDPECGGDRGGKNRTDANPGVDLQSHQDSPGKQR